MIGSSATLKKVDIEVDVENGEKYDIECPESVDGSVEEAGSIHASGKRSMSLLGFIANTTNAVVGAGILALPYTFGQVGYGTGIILLLFGAFVAWWGLHLLSLVANRVGEETQDDNLSFGSVAEMASKYLKLLVAFLTMVNCFVMTVAYLNTFADFMVQAAQFFVSGAIDPSAWYSNRTIFLLIGWGIAIPLSLPRKVSVLQYTSIVAVLMVLYTCFLVLAYAFQPVENLCVPFLEANNATECVGDRCCLATDATTCCIGEVAPFGGSLSTLLYTFPTMMSAFCCAAQLFAMYNAFKNPTMKRLDIGTSSAISLCLVLYLIIALAGYFTYGNTISDDLLSSYPATVEATIARIGIAIVLVFSYPLFAHVARDSLMFMVQEVTCCKRESLRSSSSKAGRILFFTCAIVILLGSFLLSLLQLSLSFLLNFVGSICVVNLAFTFPALFYWVLFRDEGLTATRVSCIFLGIFGVGIMLFNIVLWFL